MTAFWEWYMIAFMVILVPGLLIPFAALIKNKIKKPEELHSKTKQHETASAAQHTQETVQPSQIPSPPVKSTEAKNQSITTEKHVSSSKDRNLRDPIHLLYLLMFLPWILDKLNMLLDNWHGMSRDELYLILSFGGGALAIILLPFYEIRQRRIAREKANSSVRISTTYRTHSDNQASSATSGETAGKVKLFLTVFAIIGILMYTGFLEKLAQIGEHVLTGVFFLFVIAMLLFLATPPLMAMLFGKPKSDRKLDPAQEEYAEALIRDMVIRSARKAAKPKTVSKTKKETRKDRRREESNRIWAEIMRDEDELDDDEL